MHKVIFCELSTEKIEKYISRYKLFYFELFNDSGIWSYEQILSHYIQEGDIRLGQIYDIISKKLSNTISTYPNNEAIIKWKTKVILVSFHDEGDTRIIIDLDIR